MGYENCRKGEEHESKGSKSSPCLYFSLRPCLPSPSMAQSTGVARALAPLFFLDDFALRQFRVGYKGARVNYDPVWPPLSFYSHFAFPHAFPPP